MCPEVIDGVYDTHTLCVELLQPGATVAGIATLLSE